MHNIVGTEKKAEDTSKSKLYTHYLNLRPFQLSYQNTHDYK